MTNKQLYFMLLGGALLASCSVDDGIDTNPVASVNPNSPVFTVYFDNGQELDQDTRAIFDITKGMYDVTLEKEDCLSLFHGVEVKDGTTNDNKTPLIADDATFENVVENAIYKGESEGDKYKLGTQAMVKEGLAVMVYPADLDFSYQKNDKKPVVSISDVQDKDTKKATPYASAAINIGAYDDKGTAGTAGYGRDYDIALKRIGATLCLTLNLEEFEGLPTDVDQLKITGVKLKNGTEIFAKTATIDVDKVKVSKKVIVDSKETVEDAYEGHSTWVAGTTATPDNFVSSFETSDILATKNTKTFVATFTMLPFAENVTVDNNFSIDVTTNYGTITIDNTTELNANKDGEKTLLWNTGDTETTTENKVVPKKPVTIKDGLTNAIGKLWAKRNAKPNAPKLTFEDEKAGGFVTATISVPVAGNLVMNNIHVTDETHLDKLAKVIDALKPKYDNISLVLDGSETSNTFVMNKDGQEAYAKLLDYKYTTENAEDVHPVQFSLCKGGSNCTTNNKNKTCELVKLVSYEANQAVPTLKFADKVRVQLAGECQWTIGEGEYENVEFLSVAENAKAVLGATVSNKSETTTTTIENHGTITVSSDNAVYQYMLLNNYGTINVTKGQYVMGNEKGKVTNKATITDAGYKAAADGKPASGVFSKAYKVTNLDDAANVKRGIINVSAGASLYATQGKGGQFINEGEINLYGTAYALIAQNYKTNDDNATDADILAPISENNIFGVVNCLKADETYGESSKVNDIAGGFVKAASGKYNYLVVDNESENKIPASARPKYIEVRNVPAGTELKGDFDNLIVCEHSPKLTMTVTEDTKIKEALYLRGTIIVSNDKLGFGDNTKEKALTNYFGGTQNDENNLGASNKQ